MARFLIHGTTLEWDHHAVPSELLEVHSIPRPYTVTFHSGDGAGNRLDEAVRQHAHALLLADEWVFGHYLDHGGAAASIPRFVVPAVEDKKSIATVLEIVDFLEQHGATKSSMLFTVGGGILQDLGAFAAYLYKRGIPWTFVPTTLLAQADSSVGGKTALNHRHTKNLLALFSAPRHIIADTGFLATLSMEDWLSGAGEMLRLCITGGEPGLLELERGIDALVARDPDATCHLIRTSLAVKQAVVEYDEFELDIRRSMNYGHSFGHALEALTDYRIPHGAGVTLGILVENEVSHRRGILPTPQRDRILRVAQRLVSDQVWVYFRSASMDGILALLARDKKTVGTVLRLATLAQLGQIDFLDLPLNAEGEAELRAACAAVIAALDALRRA